MAKRGLVSIIESPMHPNFSALYKRLDIREVRLNSMRKAIAMLKNNPPDIIVAEFFYGFGNNYAGVNISNVDVLLYSMQKYCPDTRVIVMVHRSERKYVDKLNDIIPLHAVLQQPLSERAMEEALSYD